MVDVEDDNDDEPRGRVVVGSATTDDHDHGHGDGTPLASQSQPPRPVQRHHQLTEQVWNELVSWVTPDGGWVHPHLHLRAGDASTGRGVFASQPIRRGETLIRLPVSLSIHGQNLPHEYYSTPAVNSNTPIIATSTTMETPVPTDSSLLTTKRFASPWLRCLAAYLKLVVATAKAHDHHHHPYLASLPETYDTLWQWSDDEITHYLAGTRPPSTTTTESTSWKVDWTALRQRYKHQIRPYLVHCKILKNATEESVTDEEEEVQQFARACQVLSTRGFHMEPSTHQNDSAHNNNNITGHPTAAGSLDRPSCNDDCYAGPFLLPVMDLLNHGSPVEATATTLRRETDALVMRAERDVAAHQEIRHSYDMEDSPDRTTTTTTSLGSSQFLASFGFVPRDRMERAAACDYNRNDDDDDQHPAPTTPVLLSKTDDVWQACWEVMESEFPIKLARRMREQDMDDEAWSLSVDRSRKADCVPDNILISVPFDSNNDNNNAGKADETLSLDASLAQLHVLTDELVTAVAVPLLPQCAYSEITDRTLLDRSILQDYFLGQLVGAVLLKIVDKKLASYTPIPDEQMQQLLLSTSVDDRNNGSSLDQDRQILQRLLDSRSNTKIDDGIQRLRQHLAYGLTVRIEEKNTLEALRRQAVTLLALLDSSDLAQDANSSDDDLAVKKRKVDGD